jgi:hypothetical protein
MSQLAKVQLSGLLTCSVITADFMSLLPPELLAGMNSGELELDFENLDQVGRGVQSMGGARAQHLMPLGVAVVYACAEDGQQGPWLNAGCLYHGCKPE